MWNCFKTVIVKVFHSDNLEKGSKVIMWKCFIVKVFHSDNLKMGRKVINVEMFQNSHCHSVSQRQPKKG